MPNCYVYFFYDSNDALLYIGKSISLINRLKSHFSKKSLEVDVWKYTIDKQNIVIYKCDNPTDMDLYETYFINKYKPIYNSEKVFNYSPKIKLPELEPKTLLKDEGTLYSLYKKGTKEEQDTFEKNWRKYTSDPKIDYDSNNEGNIDFCYYMALKGKD